MAVTTLSNLSAEHVERWQRSGLSQAAYCREHGINPNTFSSWLGIYKSRAHATPALIPVQVEAAPQARDEANHLVLRHANGHQLELPGTQSPQWVAELWRCLG